MPALRDVPKVPAHKERPQMPSTEWRRRNYRTTCSKTRTNTVASILERSNRKDSALSITPIDSIRRAIARRNGVADPTVSDGAHGQGGRIENGLFPASHTAEELARIQELSQRNAGGPDSSQATRRRRERDRQPGPIHRMVNAWWNRLLGAVYGGGFSTQEAEYEDHATRRDYLWNTLGTAVWGMAFPLLTIVSTQLVGAEEAGKFSIAFVTGTLIMIACNYGVRNFQVSDIDEKTSFASYQLNRWICGALALACGLVYSSARGYDAQMATIGLGVYLYKVIDGIADVYEGRLQQADKLYLAGMSQTLRSVGVIAVFSVVLFLTRSMPIAAMAMGVTAIASLVLVTAPLALLETEKSRRVSLREVGHLFIQCAPLFGALFLFNLIESMPKFVMEGTLAYKYQLYFNALFFPAQAILLSIGFIYKPQLLRLSSIWANPRKRRRFDLIIVAVMALIVVITSVCAAFMAGPGIPLMSFMYGLNFARYRDRLARSRHRGHRLSLRHHHGAAPCRRRHQNLPDLLRRKRSAAGDPDQPAGSDGRRGELPSHHGPTPGAADYRIRPHPPTHRARPQPVRRLIGAMGGLVADDLRHAKLSK